MDLVQRVENAAPVRPVTTLHYPSPLQMMANDEQENKKMGPLSQLFWGVVIPVAVISTLAFVVYYGSQALSGSSTINPY